MKVDHSLLPDRSVPGVEPGVTGRAGTREGRPAEGDRVSVSEAARELARLRAEVGPVEAGDAARVTDLRTAVAAGRYAFDSTRVAQSLLRDVLGQVLV
jgi:flagellar biosynthesis anti-sigma factor FlgM